jgi:hypothetical protein
LGIIHPEKIEVVSDNLQSLFCAGMCKSALFSASQLSPLKEIPIAISCNTHFIQTGLPESIQHVIEEEKYQAPLSLQIGKSTKNNTCITKKTCYFMHITKEK